MADRSNPPATAEPALRLPLVLTTFLALLVPLSSIPKQAQALQTVSGSPCADICSDSVAGTLNQNSICLDNELAGTEGAPFRDCVSCELNSTAVDSNTNTTDVDWGLFNLRYILSECMFALPHEIVSISSPCQVTCQPLNSSIPTDFTIANNGSGLTPSFDFCNIGTFDDTDINNCAFCYSLIPEQLFLANFLQALHIACRTPPAPGRSFFPDGQAIFNNSLIAGPSTAAPTTPSTGLHGWKLAIAIALPIVGGIILFSLVCFGCFVFTRRRRQRMAASGRMSKLHNAFDAGYNGGGMYSPISPKVNPSQYEWPIGQSEPAREMQDISSHGKGKHTSPGLAQGRWSQHKPSPVATNFVVGEDEAGTPLSAQFQQNTADVVAHDPNLHERYFGIADGGEDEVPVSAGPSGNRDSMYRP